MNAPRLTPRPAYHFYGLLGMTCLGLLLPTLVTKPTQAADSRSLSASMSASAQVVAQAASTTSPERGSTLPWAIAGGVAVVAVGGAAGLYAMGRQAGKQEAKVHQALDEYKQLTQLADAPLSPLEQELRQMKSADPVQVPVQPPAQPLQVPAQALPVVADPIVAVPTPAASQASAASIDEVFGSVGSASLPDLPPPRSTAMPVQNAMPVRNYVQPSESAKSIVPTSPPQPAGQVIPANAPIEGELVTPNSDSSALATSSSGLASSPRLPQVGAIEALMQDLQTRDLEKRRKAIWELGQRGDTRAVQPLVDLMLDADSKQRSLILSALSEIGTRTLKPMGRALAISLQDDNPEVRKNAIRDLTRVYDLIAQISQMVQRATDDPDEEVRDTANWALKQLNRIRPPAMENAGVLKQSVSRPENLL